jgi:type 2 lantibiotic biosynthesis protein LanM
MYESFHPDLLRDALDRDRFFDRLWGEATHRPHLARLIAAERRDLLRGDIPVFSTTPDSRTVFTSDGDPVPDLVEQPSLDVVRRRLEALGEDDRVAQTWIVEASLATLLMGRESSVATRVRVPRRERSVTHDDLVACATGLGERIGQVALQDAGAAFWLGVGPLDEATWGVFPTGADLYAGAAGIALFLAYLGAVTGERSHAELAERALAAVHAHVGTRVEAEPRADAAIAATTLGAFDGVGSTIYLLTNLGVLWRRSDLLDDAEELVRRLPPLIASDTSLDIVYGSAGCILALLGLHAVRPTPETLDAAIRCGDHLLASARPMSTGIAWSTLKGQPPLGGFSHGTAGIALGLLQLAGRSGEERFRKAARDALEFDRSLFLPELGHWADLRVFPERERSRDEVGGSRPSAMVAWCHGAPGIGLGRLAALSELDDPTVREEIDIALDATVGHGFAMNHSLCHGALGNVELLLTAAEVLGRQRDQEALEAATAAVVSSIDANGPVCGVPLGVETPGLMTGLAGIGYELLRLAEPQTVPSVLVLAPPPARTDGDGTR